MILFRFGGDDRDVPEIKNKAEKLVAGEYDEECHVTICTIKPSFHILHLIQKCGGNLYGCNEPLI